MTHEEELLHKRLKRLLKAAPDGTAEFKNYKDMCESLKLPVKHGNSKKAQLTHLSYFCDIYKNAEGHGYSFTEVYEDPDQLILQRNAIVLDVESILLLSFLEKQASSPEILLNDYGLWRLFGFINNKYSGHYFENKFKEQYQITGKQFNYFKDRSTGRFQDVMMSTLNKLKDRSCIEFFPAKIITIKGKHSDAEQREATAEEIQRVLGYQSEVLEEMGYKSIRELRLDGKSEEFYQKRLEKIKENETDWLHYSSGFRIVVNNNNWLEKGLKRNLEEKKSYQEKVNSSVIKLINKSAETSYNNYIEQLKAEFMSYQNLHPGALLEDNKDKCKSWKKQKDIMEENFLNNYQLFIKEFMDLDSEYISKTKK